MGKNKLQTTKIGYINPKRQNNRIKLFNFSKLINTIKIVKTYSKTKQLIEYKIAEF